MLGALSVSRKRKRRATSRIPRECDHEDRNEGFQHCCNAQHVVDVGSQMIAATAVDRSGTELGHWPPIPDAAVATASRMPEEELVDAGYGNERDLAEPETRNIRGNVAPGREGRKQAAIDRDLPRTECGTISLRRKVVPSMPRGSRCPKRQTDGSRRLPDSAASVRGAGNLCGERGNRSPSQETFGDRRPSRRMERSRDLSRKRYRPQRMTSGDRQRGNSTGSRRFREVRGGRSRPATRGQAATVGCGCGTLPRSW